jgi:hypothetical protein
MAGLVVTLAVRGRGERSEPVLTGSRLRRETGGAAIRTNLGQRIDHAKMIGAVITNIAVVTYAAIPMAVVLLLVSAWIAWLRFGRYAVQPRTRTGGAVPEPT